ncbi:hypothetical protein Lal_00045797 [Lupinus albus]|uniref:Putative pentatricopeptide n=1 Tax=Lupinus albus TaxID=3870 RepID=A0A6A5NFR0_LUPAL|nr:putative pentatricopeptide [Lupinus albus]KAF1886564.1 hypothetical protein Lal_00045797 [Lupinus albus]
MFYRTLLSRQKFNKLNAFLHSHFPKSSSTFLTFPHTIHHSTSYSSSIFQSFPKYFHSTRVTQLSTNSLVPVLNSNDLGNDDDLNTHDATMNEFLSRFVWIMRKRVTESYPDSDKQTIDGMLLVIIEKVVSELEKGGFENILEASSATGDFFSEDLWSTVWEVSNKVLDDMNKERKKEKMKGFLQCEEVKEMCRFAGEVGIRGDLLREMRFKWAREKMEEHDFYEGLERIKKEADAVQAEEENQEGIEDSEVVGEENMKDKVVTLPKRKGKIKYKIYGLDLSDPKWEQVADRIHEAGQVIWPEEPKPITGKCKLVTEKIGSLKADDDNLLTLLVEWKELLQPSRVDWISLLDRLKQKNPPLYFKVAEMLLTEDSFQTNISDYSKLIDIYAKESRFDDAESLLKKMKEKGILPDAPTASVLVHMYSKVGSVERAKEAFETLRSYGFQPDVKVYTSMIMAHVTAGNPKDGEVLMRDMETRDIKPTKEIYMALLRSYSQHGDVLGVKRIFTTMEFAGFKHTLETSTLLIEANAHAGDPDQARSDFDLMMKLGHKPDDRCTAGMIAAYQKKNLLDKALNLLLELENNGFEPGVATYSVLVDWLGELQLVEEAEHLLGKISLLGEAPPLKVQVSLCAMYARAGNEKKVLQTLGFLEARKDKLGLAEFEKIIRSLVVGGFEQDARRIRSIMEARGFTISNQNSNSSKQLKMDLAKLSLRSPSMR